VFQIFLFIFSSLLLDDYKRSLGETGCWIPFLIF